MDNLIEKANRGRNYWLHLERQPQDYVLLLPNIDAEVHQLMKTIYAEMLERKQVHGIVLSVREGSISVVQTEELLQLYSLYRFTDRLIIGSLDQPYGRQMKNLLMIPGMDLEKVIRSVLFDLGEKAEL